MLAKHPEHAEKIYQELLTCDINDPNALATVPHLNAVIDETMRLMPPGMTGHYRMTPSQGVKIGDTYIPGNTNVTAPKYCLHRREYIIFLSHG